jgi:hypothetical protein
MLRAHVAHVADNGGAGVVEHVVEALTLGDRVVVGRTYSVTKIEM